MARKNEYLAKTDALRGRLARVITSASEAMGRPVRLPGRLVHESTSNSEGEGGNGEGEAGAGNGGAGLGEDVVDLAGELADAEDDVDVHDASSPIIDHDYAFEAASETGTVENASSNGEGGFENNDGAFHLHLQNEAAEALLLLTAGTEMVLATEEEGENEISSLVSGRYPISNERST